LTSFSAVFDACVLYPAPLRDLLMQLALTDLFRAKWTERIHDEWTRNLLCKRPDLTPGQLQRTRELMNTAVRDCLVTGYEYLIDSLTLPDADDRHVLAAAMCSGCSVIVTFNLKDFPHDTLDAYDIEAQHPDEFVADLIDLDPSLVLAAVGRCRANLKNPPKSQDEYLDTLLKQGLPRSVALLRQWSVAF
jgi:hypothetical protein